MKRLIVLIVCFVPLLIYGQKFSGGGGTAGGTTNDSTTAGWGIVETANAVRVDTSAGKVFTKSEGALKADQTAIDSLEGAVKVANALGLKANIASPSFTGTVTIPTPFTLGATSVTPDGTELNYVDGVTSSIQTQIGTKANTASPTFTGTATSPTVSASGAVGASPLGTTGYQFKSLASTITDNFTPGLRALVGINAFAVPTIAGDNSVSITNAATWYIAGAPAEGANMSIYFPYSLYIADGNTRLADTVKVESGITIGNAKIEETELEILDGATLSTAELNYVDGVTSAIQTQLAAKADLSFSFTTYTASDTLELTDAGKVILMSVAGANNITVRTNAERAFSIGTQITIVQTGAGQTTIVAEAGVTINSADGDLKLRVQFSSATLIKTATNTWILVGDIDT